jgi:hypothetical protein
MTMVISGSDGITFPDSTTQNTTDRYGFVNRIINGDMRIDQRNNGASITPSDAAYGLDRWSFRLSQPSKFTTQQNAGGATPPTGFTNYLGVTSSSAYTVGASEFFTLVQYIEGYNLADLAWGTASAQTVTLSFWVRSSLTGTFGGSFNNTNNARSYPFTFSISAANTWEQKTVVVPGDTSGTWDTTTGRGVGVRFNLGAGASFSGTAGSWSGSTFFAPTGAVSVVGTNGATFYITGVQLEVGSVATPFERRPYGTELALCQRYCQVSGGEQSTQTVMVGVSNGTTVSTQSLKPYVKFRTLPTLSLSAVSDFGWLQFSPFVTNTPSSASIITANSSSDYIYIDWGISGGTSGATQFMRAANTNAKLILSAEL